MADDVLLAVKERARRQRRSSGEVLSDLAREALTRQGHAGHTAEPEAFHGFQP
ncbi:MAG TPA: antitoxin, partial [Thermoanaerobaculia bacterium]|nr:antitoxin [Thermoanaerobaculia bacterium]